VLIRIFRASTKVVQAQFQEAISRGRTERKQLGLGWFVQTQFAVMLEN